MAHVETRREIIRKYLQTLNGATVLAKKELLGKTNQGVYDESINPLFYDVQNEGIDPDIALENLSKLLGEELPTLEKRARKPVDRRLTGITESPHAKGPIDRSSCCGICFQSQQPPDEWCGVCGVGVHTNCAQFEGSEAPPDAISPFRIDVDKGSGHRTCGYCKAYRRMTSRGVRDLSKPSEVICEFCEQAGPFALLTTLSGAATKWVHVCCARFLPGSSLGLTGARRYAGGDKDTEECSICKTRQGVVTRCVMCDEDSAAKLHVYCALSQGQYGIRPLDLASPQKRLLCPIHKAKMFSSNSASKRSSSGNGAVLPSTPLGIAMELQSTFHPSGKSDRCGVCLIASSKPNEKFLVCDGCDVRIHVHCFQRVGTQVPNGEPFYCNRCSERTRRGRIGKCAMCPHVSASLALQPAIPQGSSSSSSTAQEPSKSYVHTVCLLKTPQQSQQQNSMHVDNAALPKCSLCGDKSGSLVRCSDCPKHFHALCMMLLCEPTRKQLQAGGTISKCLSHCAHSHPVSAISPVKVEFPIGTALRTFRRELSAVAEFGISKSSREDFSILREWQQLSNQEKVQRILSPPHPPTEPQVHPSAMLEKTLAAIARAWEQTHAEGLKKRSRGSGAALMAYVPPPSTRASASGGAAPSTAAPGTVRSSGRKKYSSSRLSGDDNERGGGGGGGGGDGGGYHSGAIYAQDAPIEVSEVWPLLEPVFRRPANTNRIVEVLDRDRACDHVLISEVTALPELKLFPDQPYSTNPYIPAVFSGFAPLERSANLQSRYPVMIPNLHISIRSAGFADADEFIARRCCLGRRKNDFDVSSLTLLTVRAMTQPSHLLLVASRSMAAANSSPAVGKYLGGSSNVVVEGLLHCTYVENENTRLAFVKINAESVVTMLALLQECLLNRVYVPKDVEINTVVLSSIDDDQEQRFWRRVFPQEMQPIVIPQGAIPGLQRVSLGGWNWVDRINRFRDGWMSGDLTFLSVEDRRDVEQCLQRGWIRINRPRRGLPTPQSNPVVKRSRFQIVFEPVATPSTNQNGNGATAAAGGGDSEALLRYQPSSIEGISTESLANGPVSAAPLATTSAIPPPPPSSLSSSSVPPQQQQPNAPPRNLNWAYTVRADLPLDAAPVVALGPRYSKYVEAVVSNAETSEAAMRGENSLSNPSPLLPMLDPPVSNTMLKNIVRLQKELHDQCVLNDKCIQVLRNRITEDQTRMKLIDRARGEIENVYKERKRRLLDRQEKARIQAERDASARCGVCRNDESFIDNPIVICEACSWAAHQNCVGLLAVPEGDWYCSNCEGKTKEQLEEERRMRQQGKRRSKKRGKMDYATAAAAAAPMNVSTNRLGDGSGQMLLEAGPSRSSSRGGGSDLDGKRNTSSNVNGASEGHKKTPHYSQVGLSWTSSSSRRAGTESGPLLCVCQSKYDEGRFMLSCDKCSNWFHPACIGLRECNDPNLSRHPNCVILENGMHTLDVADWTFKCPRCASNRGKPLLSKNERLHQVEKPVGERRSSRLSNEAEEEEDDEHAEVREEENEDDDDEDFNGEEGGEQQDASKTDREDAYADPPKRSRGRPRKYAEEE